MVILHTHRSCHPDASYNQHLPLGNKATPVFVLYPFWSLCLMSTLSSPLKVQNSILTFLCRYNLFVEFMSRRSLISSVSCWLLLFQGGCEMMAVMHWLVVALHENVILDLGVYHFWWWSLLRFGCFNFKFSGQPFEIFHTRLRTCVNHFRSRCVRLVYSSGRCVWGYISLWCFWRLSCLFFYQVELYLFQLIFPVPGWTPLNHFE